MECYFRNYDVKIGNMILGKKEAEALGLASSDDSILGKVAKVVKDGLEIAEGKITRVLRGICFSGCGIVKNPANPPSVILETAKEKDNIDDDNEVIVLDYDKIELSNKVTTESIEIPINKEESTNELLDDSVGICVSYKRMIKDKEDNILNNDWCAMYDKGCTSFSRDTTDPNCLRNKDIERLAKAALDKLFNEKAAKDKRKELLDGLKAALREAVKT
jgi:hypothetical protein